MSAEYNNVVTLLGDIKVKAAEIGEMNVNKKQFEAQIEAYTKEIEKINEIIQTSEQFIREKEDEILKSFE